MARMSITDAVKKAGTGKVVELAGWVHRKREGGGLIFVVVRDRTGILQVAIKKAEVDQKSWDAAAKCTIESSIKVRGVVKQDARAPTGYELAATGFSNTHVSEPFPITEYQSTELLLDKRHLWLRSQKMTAIMRARSYIFRYAREFLDKKGFYEITPPLITTAGGETGSNLFQLDYFGEKMYLTESSQLYAEAMVPTLEKVYSFAPSYRAEKSRTVKHLAEYWHLEPEMAYYNLSMNMKLQESLVSRIAQKVATHSDILKTLGVDAEGLLKIKPPFKRITYEKALEILNDKKAPRVWGDDFGVEDELLLTQDEERPIFITHFPREIKPFYMPINPKDDRTVMAADMLAPKGHGEIIGGSERIWNYQELMERLAEVEKRQGIKFDVANYDWWIDLRRYGSVPHAGFGMGIERIIKWMLNLDHIRDAIPFPRMVNRMRP